MGRVFHSDELFWLNELAYGTCLRGMLVTVKACSPVTTLAARQCLQPSHTHRENALYDEFWLYRGGSAPRFSPTTEPQSPTQCRSRGGLLSFLSTSCFLCLTKAALLEVSRADENGNIMSQAYSCPMLRLRYFRPTAVIIELTIFQQCQSTFTLHSLIMSNYDQKIADNRKYYQPSNVVWGGSEPDVCISLAASPLLCTWVGTETPPTDVGSYTDRNAVELAFTVSL